MDEVELLRQLVAIDSVSKKEKKIAEFLERLLPERGFSTKRLEIAPGRFNVLAERPGKREQGAGDRKPIGLYGHIDSVEPADGWKTDPFALLENGDKLIGLGAWDMKAGIAAIICAVSDPSARPVKIAFGVDEENISEGAHAISKSGFFDDCGVIVSTDTGGDGGEHSGERQLTLGRLGRAVFEFTIPGKASHAASKEGINALEEGARLLLELKKIRPKKHKLLPPPPIFVRSFHGETSSLSVPDKAILQLDRHLVPPETAESVLAELENLVESLYRKKILARIDGKGIEVRLKYRKTPYLMPQITDRNNPNVKKFEKMIKENFGEPKIVYGNSVADENVLALNGVPVITYGPSGGNMHSAGEWVSKRSYLNLIRGLTLFLEAS